MTTLFISATWFRNPKPRCSGHPISGASRSTRSRRCWPRWGFTWEWRSQTGHPRTSKNWPSASTNPIEDPMRHRLRGRSFSRKSAHRKAMFENLAAALIKHEQITTTLPKAKDLRPIVERLITIGKHGGLAGRRRAIAVLQDTKLAEKLMTI